MGKPKLSSPSVHSIDKADDLSEVSLLGHLRRSHRDPRAPSSLKNALLFIFHLVLLSISGTMLLAAILIKGSIPKNCQEEQKEWSLLMGSRLNTYKTVRFEDNLLDDQSPYKGPPSPVVDAAWNRLTDFGAMRITEEVFQQLNASKHAVEVPPELGGGRMAFLESIHQIHCVQSLWKTTYPDYYTDLSEFAKGDPDMWHKHMDHCANILRQKLMCDADIGIVTYNWLKGHLGPHPNFNVQHHCRDFDAVLRYAFEHQIDGSMFKQGYFLRPTNRPWVDFEKPPYDPLADN